MTIVKEIGVKIKPGERTWTEVVVFEDVALQAAAGREVFGAVGYGTAGPQGAGVLLVLLGVDVEAAACRELGVAPWETDRRNRVWFNQHEELGSFQFER